MSDPDGRSPTALDFDGPMGPECHGRGAPPVDDLLDVAIESLQLARRHTDAGVKLSYVRQTIRALEGIGL